MFRPNTTGLLSRHLGRNAYAEFTFEQPVAVPCAIVHLTTGVQKTPVRADSSASRANAEEKVATAKILFPKTVSIGTNDKFSIMDQTLRVIGIEKRKDVFGALDHFEVDFDNYPS